jgi:hypothetical protein
MESSITLSMKSRIESEGYFKRGIRMNQAYDHRKHPVQYSVK